MRDLDRFRGCLIGGAAGAALGYAIEFDLENVIFRRYGARGITEYEPVKGVALISDDTQMTLFTATGLLTARTRELAQGSPADYHACIGASYRNWLYTQQNRFPLHREGNASWLISVPGLFSPRAPGGTCLHALGGKHLGSTAQPVNQSKGCGGVMRAAPVGLLFNDLGADIRDICRLGAETAALTHGHPLGWLPGAVLAVIVHAVSQDGASVADAVQLAMETMRDVWPELPEVSELIALLEKAVRLAAGKVSDLDAIHELGEGWVGDEALAIAVFCALRHEGDIDGALISSVNHKGDSDSTGAIAGNIIGAQVGLSGIPAKYTELLELKELILEVADDLWKGQPAGEEDEVWREKYLTMTYRWGK